MISVKLVIKSPKNQSLDYVTAKNRSFQLTEPNSTKPSPELAWGRLNGLDLATSDKVGIFTKSVWKQQNYTFFTKNPHFLSFCVSFSLVSERNMIITDLIGVSGARGAENVARLPENIRWVIENRIENLPENGWWNLERLEI